jgi:uncharacterized membrane protein YfcA
MTIATLTLLIFLGSLLAGLLGALTGLGGGVVIVPMLTLAFGVDLRYAIGASLISVIATSSGAAAAYVKEGFTNVRIGMFLEMATTAGAIGGAYLAGLLPTGAIAVIFGLVLIVSAWLSYRSKTGETGGGPPNALAQQLRLDGDFPSPTGPRHYHVQGVPAGFGLMGLAGMLSGLLGIGSGAVKVLALDQAMKVPFKVSTTTSNFMIGVTAAASAGVYLGRGYVDPGLSLPVMLGVLIGALTGARLLPRAKVQLMRALFAVVIVALGLQMIANGLLGRI